MNTTTAFPRAVGIGDSVIVGVGGGIGVGDEVLVGVMEGVKLEFGVIEAGDVFIKVALEIGEVVDVDMFWVLTVSTE